MFYLSAWFHVYTQFKFITVEIRIALFGRSNILRRRIIHPVRLSSVIIYGS